MATLTPTLTLTSTDATADQLSLSVTDSLTVKAPIINLSRIASEGSGGSVVNVVAPSITGHKFLYIKHTGFQANGSSSTAAELIVSIAGNDGIRLNAGEFSYFPVKTALSVGVQSNTSETIQVEYGYWTRS